jgi:predicted acylesterase/phospholipase RssA
MANDWDVEFGDWIDPEKDFPTILVLSSGGIKGICQLGVLHKLIENSELDLDLINTYAGTSIGSVISFLLILGYKPLEIFVYIYHIYYFIQPNTQSPWNIFNEYGLMDIRPHFLSIFKPFAEEKCPDCMNLTLGDIKRRYNKNLYVTVTNQTDMEVEYLSHETHPELSVMEALMMSCNMPLVFQRIKHDDKYYVDGAILDSCPIKLVDDHKSKILCIYTTAKDDNKQEVIYSNNIIAYVYKFLSYIYSFISMMMKINLKLQLAGLKDNVRLIEIKADTPLIHSVVSSDDKMELFQYGINLVTDSTSGETDTAIENKNKT